MAALLLIVAAGSGSRLGRGEPKALVPLAGRPLLAWALDALAPARLCADRRGGAAGPARRSSRGSPARGARVVAGGDTRSESVRRGVEALAPADGDVVAIHDAARPFVTAAEIEAVLRAAQETRRGDRGDAGRRHGEASRRRAASSRRSTATGSSARRRPRPFAPTILRRALGAGGEATDEAALCERLGIPVAVVPVSRLCFKITTPEDLELAEAILARRGR